MTLIARKNGSSSSRRQRKFAPQRIEAAIARWRKEGFNVFWVFDHGELLRHWRDGDNETRA